MKPSSRQELIEYSLRQLGAPVLEINVAPDQIEDLVDDALQLFNERHFDGVVMEYLKYEVTKEDTQRGLAVPPNAPAGSAGRAGITSTSAVATIPPTVGQPGVATTFTYYQNSNYIQIPPNIIGIDKVFQLQNGVMGTGMWNLQYQYFLNAAGLFGGIGGASGFDMLSYSMTMSYLETVNFLLNTHVAIRFNQRQDRLYLDINWEQIPPGQFLVIQCYRALEGVDATRVWNDPFLKKYTVASLKRQWGMNMIKFNGVKLPGGIELNGRQIYEDGQREMDTIIEMMPTTYELPPLDEIA